MAQQLRAYTALPGDPDLMSSTYTGQLIAACDSSSRGHLCLLQAPVFACTLTMHMRRVNKNHKLFKMKTAHHKRFIYDQIAVGYFICMILLSLLFLIL